MPGLTPTTMSYLDVQFTSSKIRPSSAPGCIAKFAFSNDTDVPMLKWWHYDQNKLDEKQSDNSGTFAMDDSAILALVADIGNNNVSDLLVYFTQALPALSDYLKAQPELISEYADQLRPFYEQFFTDLVFSLVNRKTTTIDSYLKKDFAVIKDKIIDTIIDSGRPLEEKQAALTAILTEGSALHAVFMCGTSVKSPKVGEGRFLRAAKELTRIEGTIAPPSSIVPSPTPSMHNASPRSVSPNSRRSSSDESGTELLPIIKSNSGDLSNN